MLFSLVNKIIAANERRLGVSLDYVRDIAAEDFGLLRRYNRLFGFLDPRKHLPADAYHLARIRGALAADCGSCVEAEMNLAKNSGLSNAFIHAALELDEDVLFDDLMLVARFSDAVVSKRVDDPELREALQNRYGKSGLIELVYAMNGAALLPSIKRGLGHATSCDLQLLKSIKV